MVRPLKRNHSTKSQRVELAQESGISRLASL